MSSYLIYYTLLSDREIYCISSVEAYKTTKLLSFQSRKEDDDQKLAFREGATHLYFLAFSKMSSTYHFLLEGVAESKWHLFIIQTKIPALTISLLWP